MDWTNPDQWNNRSKADRMSDHVEMAKLGKKYRTFRLVGKSVVKMSHWFKVNNKDGKAVRFSKPCHGTYIADDGSTQIDASKCPYCSICESTPTPEVFTNAIDRDAQENEPKKKGKPTRAEKKKQKLLEGVAFFKENKESELWTPMVGVRATTSLGKKISEIASLNTKKIDGVKKAFGPNHPKYGFDLLIKYDEDAASPNDMYGVQKGELTKLTEEEMEYARWHFPIEVTESETDARKEANSIKPRMLGQKGELLFPELSEKGGKSKKKGDHGKYRDQFDDDDDAEDDDDDDRRKKSKKSKGKSRRDDDDDDDFDDGVDEDEDDEDEDDEDDRRSKKSKKSKSKKSSKKRSRDDDDEDDDEDEEDDDSDEDDDEDESDDDEDDDEDEEDDEDDRRSKKSKKSKSKKQKDGKNGKKKKRSRDLDDDIPF